MINLESRLWDSFFTLLDIAISNKVKKTGDL